MANNLVLTAAVGYDFKQIELFIRSLRKYYFDKVYIIIDKKDNLIEYEIKKFNCNVIKTSINKKDIQFQRYKIYTDLLNKKNFENILLCDSRDIYFQNDPFKYNYSGSINFFLEDFKIKDCPYNSNWLIKTYGKNEFEKIADKTILCSGTVLGSQKKIKEYLNLMVKNISKFKYKKRLKYFLTFRTDPEGRGCDQGHANYLVHNKIINDCKFYNNFDGPVATVFYLNKINFDKDSRLLNTLGNPYLVIHQYDKRWEEFTKHFEKIKKSSLENG